MLVQQMLLTTLWHVLKLGNLGLIASTCVDTISKVEMLVITYFEQALPGPFLIISSTAGIQWFSGRPIGYEMRRGKKNGKRFGF